LLVLARRLEESIMIGDDIEIKVVGIQGEGSRALIRLGITAPRSLTVLRREIYLEVQAENRLAAQAAAPPPDFLPEKSPPELPFTKKKKE
jgi:carbon storage regulator